MKTVFKDIKESHTITPEEVFGQVPDLLEYYNRDERTEFVEIINRLDMPNLDSVIKPVRKFKSLNTIPSINDGSVEKIQNIRYDIRNAINTTLEIKDKFNDIRQYWKEIQYLTKRIYERTKDSILITDSVKELKNDGLRIAEVNFRLKDLIKAIDKLEIFLTRFKQVEDELKEMLTYLQDLQNENSRVQSAIQLALDTGELERTYWQKDWKKN